MLPKKSESQQMKDDLKLYKKRAHDYWRELKTLRTEGTIMHTAINAAIVSLASESSRQAIIELLRAAVSGTQSDG